MRITEISIRTRVIALISTALVACLATFLYLAQKLIISDKSSYILDSAYSRVSTTSEIIRTTQHRFSILSDLAKHSGLQNLATSPSQPILGRLGFTKAGELEVKESKGNITSHDIMKGLTWSADELKNLASPLMFIDPQGQFVEFISPLSEASLFFARIVPGRGLMETQSRDVELHVIQESDIRSKLSSEVHQLFQGSKFVSGVREITLRGEPYLLGYEKLTGTDYWVFTLTSKKIAFAAAEELKTKTLILGSGLVLLTLGFALLLIRNLVHRIQALVQSTQLVSRGDFSQPVTIGLQSKDELGALSRAFNLMIGKIHELIIATADKAHMEKELETAQAVQKRFFPSEPLCEQGIVIDGHSLPASLCGGDFWNYAKVGQHIIVVIGDVTGHGLPAAFVTASIHSSFSNFVDQLHQKTSKINPETEILAPLLQLLNRTIFFSSSGNDTFPCLSMVIDTETHTLHYVNSGHPAPFKLKKDGTFELIAAEPHLPLGQDGEYSVHPIRVAISPSERILCYTDGLFDERRSDSTKLKKKPLLESIARSPESESETHESIRLSAQVLQRAREFFGDDPANRHDDITIVSIEFPETVAIPSSARKSAA